ncbi:TIGR02677 family protein [Allonocardiopsis opalescens]|uniref:Uncharacterized protein (TIGR02677 family) n=1 Tax=Allonocardiopsis opalescens TaxID=1144618 RepID=A0A2T0Q823_9ACTN|nr:TIGR02677 family protein [Allonocardiopsis opalescens]PRX99948.1 uncharacterized protein (TIGR02677 family) [Allonocardiopsis opalescens]
MTEISPPPPTLPAGVRLAPWPGDQRWGPAAGAGTAPPGAHRREQPDPLPDTGLGEDVGPLDAYSYLSVPDPRSRAAYLAIMRVFTSALLTDLSAPEVADRLASGPVPVVVDADDVADRLAALVRWGALSLSSRTVRVGSIGEYQRSRSRYQLTPLGERVQRQADALLADAGSAHEVSLELLAVLTRELADLAVLAARADRAPHDALRRTAAVFTAFDAFADSARGFYAYLGHVLFRPDLGAPGHSALRNLLLDYVEAITEDVAHHAPRVQAALDELWPRLPALLEAIDSAGPPGLSGGADTPVRRGRGRARADWDELRGWFTDTTGRGSEVDRLKDATLRALQALLANAKRLVRTSTGERSRRGELLRLAKWFDDADSGTAHDLFVAAFGLYGARHLGVAGEPDIAEPGAVSWWDAPGVDVPASLRERGSRAARGRTAAVDDHTRQKERLRSLAEAEAEHRRLAAAELRAALPGPTRGSVRVEVSAAARALLLDLLTGAIGVAGHDFTAASAGELDLDIALHLTRAPDAAVTLSGPDGELALSGLSLCATSYHQRPATTPGLLEDLT